MIAQGKDSTAAAAGSSSSSQAHTTRQFHTRMQTHLTTALRSGEGALAAALPASPSALAALHRCCTSGCSSGASPRSQYSTQHTRRARNACRGRGTDCEHYAARLLRGCLCPLVARLACSVRAASGAAAVQAIACITRPRVILNSICNSCAHICVLFRCCSAPLRRRPFAAPLAPFTFALGAPLPLVPFSLSAHRRFRRDGSVPAHGWTCTRRMVPREHHRSAHTAGIWSSQAFFGQFFGQACCSRTQQRQRTATPCG